MLNSSNASTARTPVEKRNISYHSVRKVLYQRCTTVLFVQGGEGDNQLRDELLLVIFRVVIIRQTPNTIAKKSFV